MIQQARCLGLPRAAEQAGISTRRAHEWRRRLREDGVGGLQDRSSRPHGHPRTLSPEKRERIVNLRRKHRLTYAEIARRTGASPATAGRICSQAGVAKLPPCETAPPIQRYERKPPGELLHLDTKKLTRFHQPGHRVTGDITRYSKTPGYQALHVAIADHSRVGFSLMLPDETVKSAMAFVFAALRYYRELGVCVSHIMTDNGSAYRSKKFAKLLCPLKICHVRTRPYTPRTNGKAERFIQTLLRGWAYAFTYPNSDARTRELPYWIIRYNFHRPHSATGNMLLATRLGFAGNNVVRNDS